MRAFAFGAALAAAAAIGAAACGGGDHGTNASGTGASATGGSAMGGSAPDDGGPGDASDASTPYPAPHSAYPKVVSGGHVLKSPKIVNVSFAGDPLETDIDKFSTAMGSTTYWGDRVAEYGIAPLVPIARIHDPSTPPATYDDSTIQTWLLGQLDGTHPEWPAPDGNTIYALYFPPGVTITAQGLGDSCTAFHGYHGNVQLPDGSLTAYAVISRCAGIPEDPAATGINYVSAVASHEVIEGITDPYPMSNTLGYYDVDTNHFVWSFLGLGELGDMCALIGNAFYTPADFPYLVQRIFSNKTAPTGHDPCLPEPPDQVYFNTAPVLNDTVTFDAEGYTGTTKGVKIPVGGTATVELDLYSEAPTPGPWSVSVKEINGSSLDLSLDKTSGVNGDKLSLTIKVNSKNTMYGAEVFLIESTLGTQRSLWVGLVGN